MKKIKFVILWIIVVLIAMTVGYFYGAQKTRKSFKNLAFIYHSIGREYYKRGKYMEAITFYNRAIAIDITSFWIHNSLADSYYLNGNFKLALDEYETIVQLSLTHEKEYAVFKDHVENQIKKIKLTLAKAEDNQEEKTDQDNKEENKGFNDLVEKIRKIERGLETW